jgi:hypothetical protein
MNSRAVEGLPIRTAILAAIMLVSIYLSIYIIDSFTYFRDVESLRSSVSNIVDSMNFLESLGEESSWKETTVNIPQNSSIFVNSSSDCIEVTGFGINNTCTDYDINNSVSIEPGIYNIKIFYGENSNPEPLTIVFR